MPEVTAVFWVIKVLTTGMGETASDFLAHTIGSAAAVPLGFALFSVAMVLQLRSRRYVAWRYWIAVVMVSVFGTMVADVMHVGIGIPYVATTVMFAVLLAAVLVTWRRREGTLSIHSITTKPRELLYWGAVIATFALGTAAGDMTAVTFGWGFLVSGVVSAALFVLALLAGKVGANAVLVFWIAYVITRPLGASFADWMGLPVDRGGLGWGTGVVTGLWGAAIAILVLVVSVTRSDVAEGDDENAAGDDSSWVRALR